jgi:hypothetical protein
VTRRSGGHATNQRAAETRSTRPDVPAPETVRQFLAALFRGFDEGHAAQRGGWPR